MDKKKLKNLLETLRTGVEPLESTDELEAGVKALTSKLRKQMSAKTLEEVNSVLSDFQKKIDLKPIHKSLEDLKGSTGGMYKELSTNIEGRFGEVSKRLENGLLRLQEEQTASKSNSRSISRLEGDFKGKSAIVDEVKSLSETTAVELSSIADELRGMIKDIDRKHLETSLKGETSDKSLSELSDGLKKLRRDMLSMLSGIGGGNANRNIAVGGNTSVLSMYTDINLKPGSGITLTYSNNQTTKYTDITIASNGGSSGITRQIDTTTVSSVVGSVAGIDYVTLVNAGAKITLPPASGNSNLYTIKNIGTSSVLIVASGAETFDGDATIIMPVRYTAVDLSSDLTNWHIT